MNCFNHKRAQTLTELATFGSVLLLVLSFLVSYGMRDNYQQDTQMRSFRMAMQEAYTNSRPDPSGSVVLVEDKHIPDPRDTFGVGNIVPAQAGAGVTWGNTMEDKYYKDGTTELDPERLPLMKYKINGSAVGYETQGFDYIASARLDKFYVNLTRPSTTTPTTTLVLIDDWTKVRCYQTKEMILKDGKTELINGPKKAMILIENGPGDEDNEIEVIDEVAKANPVGAQYTPGPMMQVIAVKPDDAEQGDPITQLDLLSPSSGEINPNYLNLGGDTRNVDATGSPIYVTPATLQGLLLEDMTIKRNDSLTITQTSGASNTVTSTSTPDFTAEITHKIRSNSDTPDDPDKFISSVSYNTKGGPAAWEIKMKE